MDEFYSFVKQFYLIADEYFSLISGNPDLYNNRELTYYTESYDLHDSDFEPDLEYFCNSILQIMQFQSEKEKEE